MDKKRILLVGCGNMGRAMMTRWAGEGFGVDVVEVSEGNRERAELLGGRVYGGSEEVEGLADDVDAVVYCLKPQSAGGEVGKYNFLGSGVIHISVMAGLGLDMLEGELGGGRIVVRTMPNTPVLVGRGMMVSVGNERVDGGVRSEVDIILGVCGESLWLEEEGLMDAVTALSGSGPAYLFYYIEEMARLGEELGLGRNLSRRLALGVVSGAGLMAELRVSEGEEVGKLREEVTSEGGTAAAGLRVLMREKGGLGDVLREALLASRARSCELGGGTK